MKISSNPSSSISTHTHPLLISMIVNIPFSTLKVVYETDETDSGCLRLLVYRTCKARRTWFMIDSLVRDSLPYMLHFPSYIMERHIMTAQRWLSIQSFVRRSRIISCVLFGSYSSGLSGSFDILIAR